MNIYESVDLLRAKIPKAELLAGLAEEAAELAQAALKYRRAIDGTNPTPVNKDKAQAALYEEVADVALYLGVLDLIRTVEFANDPEVVYMDAKLKRWLERLEEAEP